MIFDYLIVINRNTLLQYMFHLLGHDLKQQKEDFSLQTSCQICCLPDRCQFNLTAVTEEVCSEPALNFVWHLIVGVVKPFIGIFSSG